MRDIVKIVSLLPSATELIAAVIEDSSEAILVGRSHECDYPEKYAQVAPLTSSTISFTTSADVDQQVREHLATGQGLYSVDAALMSSLGPDVIVTQSLCKVCSVDFCMVEKLALTMPCQPKIVDTNPQDLSEMLRDLQRIGEAIGLEDSARAVRRNLEERIDRVVGYVASRPTKETRVVMMEWTDPIFIGGHWTPQIIHMAGGTHPLHPPEKGGRWKFSGAGASSTVTPEQVAECDPDVIIIAPCGLDMAATVRETKHLLETSWWSQLRAVENGQVWLVDGNHMFNRPGPRLVDALEWVCWILHGYPDQKNHDFPAMNLEDLISPANGNGLN